MASITVWHLIFLVHLPHVLQSAVPKGPQYGSDYEGIAKRPFGGHLQDWS